MTKKLVLILIACCFIYLNLKGWNRPENEKMDKVDVVKLAPPSLQMFYRIKEYKEKYDVPGKVAFGIPRNETSYTNPLDFSYDPAKTSSANACGGFQIKLATARWVAKDNKITKHDLLHNIDKIEIGFKYISNIHKKRKSWALALGEYNTGQPVVNGYAMKILKR